MLVQNIKEREEICRKCPIFSSFRGVCNSKLWLNPETNKVSTSPKEGYIRGCGCMILQKMRIPSSHCVAGKW